MTEITCNPKPVALSFLISYDRVVRSTFSKFTKFNTPVVFYPIQRISPKMQTLRNGSNI